jgi:hypothetical protein
MTQLQTNSNPKLHQLLNNKPQYSSQVHQWLVYHALLHIVDLAKKLSSGETHMLLTDNVPVFLSSQVLSVVKFFHKMALLNPSKYKK